MFAALLTTADHRAEAQHVWVKVATLPQFIHAVTTATSSGLPTTIAVAPGTYAFTDLMDTSRGPSFLPPIASSIWIVGNDPATTTFTTRLDPAPVEPGRLFTVLAGGRLVVRNVTITRFGFGPSGPGGAAAATFGGFLRFDNSRLLDNQIGTAPDVQPNGIHGGAILNAGGRIHVQDSVLARNRVGCGSGGAVALTGGSATILRSVIRENVVTAAGCSASGGGIDVDPGAVLTLAYATIANNRAGDIGGLSFSGDGGGIFNRGSVWINNSAVIQNGVEYYGDGGGIVNSGTMTVQNTTVAGNDAGTSGGGIANRGRLYLRGVTVTSNRARVNDEDCYPETNATQRCGGGGILNEAAGLVRAARTIFAGNQARPEPFGYFGADCRGVVFSDGYNAIGDGYACDVRASWTLAGTPTHDLLNADAALGPLSDNGKPGNGHHPLLARSPLIDAGGPLALICSRRDQIDRPRNDGDHDGIVKCDIGAIEYTAP